MDQMWTRDSESADGLRPRRSDLLGWLVGLPGLEPGTSSLSGIFAGCVLAARARDGQLMGPAGSDRGCPLGTGVVRPMWHAGGTNG